MRDGAEILRGSRGFGFNITSLGSSNESDSTGSGSRMERSGDRASFDRLMTEALPAMHRFAIRLTGDVDAAEEIAQEAAVRAARSWQSFRGEAQARTWLLRIVINLFRDRVARKAPGSGELSDEISDERTLEPSAAMQNTETGALVAKLVSSLPPRQREVILLVAYEQMDQADVAKVLGVSEQNVRTNLHHARERLKKELLPYLSGESLK